MGLDKYLNKISAVISSKNLNSFTDVIIAFKNHLMNYVSAHPYLVASVFFANFFILFIILVKEKEEDRLEKILRKMKLIYVENSKDPIMSRGKPKKDKMGRSVYKTIDHIPKLDFSELPRKITLRGLHPSLNSNLFNFLNGLLNALKTAGYIEFASGEVLATGTPEEFCINLHDKKHIDEMNMYRDIRWYKKETINGIESEYFPEVSITKEEVSIKLPPELKLNDNIIRSGRETFQRFFELKIKTMFARSSDQSMIFFRYETPLEHVFKSGQTIPANMDIYNEKIITKLKQKYQETGAEHFFIGELQDPNISWPDTQIMVPSTTLAHILNVGQTRSGKTKSNGSLIMSLALAYEDSEFLFADGKGSPDYDGFARKLSNYPVAKMHSGDDPLIELANIIFVAINELDRRRAILSDLSAKGIPCSTYVEYNNYVKNRTDISEEEKKELKMCRYYIFIDEFAEFIGNAGESVEKLIIVKHSIFWGINKILRIAGSVGFTMVIASQRYQNTDFPTPIRSNLGIWMVHNINARDASSAEVEEAPSLKQGEFILKAAGIFCTDTKTNHFKCRLPYMGDSIVDAVAVLGRKDRSHKTFDMNLIYGTGKEESITKLNPTLLIKYIRQVFLDREGYQIFYHDDPETNYLSLGATDENGDKHYIGVISKEEFQDIGLTKKLKDSFINLKNRGINVNGKVHRYLFILGNPNLMRVITGSLEEEFGKFEIIPQIDFERPLKTAFKLYREGKKDKLFNKFITVDESEITDAKVLYEIPERQKDKRINSIELQRVINISGNTEKGDAFEEWYRVFELRHGFETIQARDLVDDGTIPNIFASKRAEGGFDLIRWVDKSKKIAIGIQCKNQTSKNLDISIVQKVLKSKQLYEGFGITISECLLVTTGLLTKQAMKESAVLGIKVIDFNILDSMVKEYEEMAGDDVNIEFYKQVEDRRNLSTGENFSLEGDEAVDLDDYDSRFDDNELTEGLNEDEMDAESLSDFLLKNLSSLNDDDENL